MYSGVTVKYTHGKVYSTVKYTLFGNTALTQQLYLYYVRYSIVYSPSWVPPPALQYCILKRRGTQIQLRSQRGSALVHMYLSRGTYSTCRVGGVQCVARRTK